MTPALAFFYGGLERRKNILNTMMMVICTLGLASILWIAIGYSLSFSAVVGLVAITPGAGFVSLWSSIIIGFLVSPFCFYFISVIKQKLQLDDALDAFGCHGVGGIFGGIMTGIFADPAVGGKAGLFYGNVQLFLAQLESIIFTIVFAGLLSFVIISVIKFFMPIRVTDSEEALGMDRIEHDETAYPTFMGLDS